MFERIKQMIIKEFIQIFRDPKMRTVIILVPLIQMIIFGYAITTDVKNILSAVYDEDDTVLSREATGNFLHSGYFTVVDWIHSDAEVQKILDKGKALVVIHFKKGFEEEIKSGNQTAIQIIVDGSESNTAGIASNYAARVIQRFSQQIAIKKLALLPERPLLEIRSRTWFNPNLESRNFYIPGIVAILITLMTLTLTSMAIVREKEVGTMEQIIVTPITRVEFIIGKTVPFILIGFVQISIILLVAVYWFEVNVKGNVGLLYLGASLYLLTTLGIGLFISTISQTQQQAMMSALLFYFPAVLLSGFIFPIANMPKVIQWFTYFNPLMYFLIIIRGVFLKGIGIDVLWPQIMALAIMGLFVLSLAVQRFKKTMS